MGQVAFDHFPIHILSNLVTRRCRNMDAKSVHYGEQMGSKALRETIASYLRTARSLHCDADQVMIVSGSQQALEISARVLFDPGSPVWVEDPGYALARAAFALTGCHLVPVPVDQEGLDVAAGIRRCRKARAAFVTPSHQFPLGVTMSATRRLQLLDWAQSSGAWIIEDDYDSEYRYESPNSVLARTRQQRSRNLRRDFQQSIISFFASWLCRHPPGPRRPLSNHPSCYGSWPANLFSGSAGRLYC